MYAFFVDLRPAFDSVNRASLWEVMRGHNIDPGFIERIVKIYAKIRNVLYVKGRKFNDRSIRYIKGRETRLYVELHAILNIHQRDERRTGKRADR